MISEETFVKVFDELVKIKTALEDDPGNHGLNKRYYQLLHVIFGEEVIGVHSGNKYIVVDVDHRGKMLKVLREDGELTLLHLSSVHLPVSKSQIRRKMKMLSHVRFSGLSVQEYPQQHISKGERVTGYLYIDENRRYFVMKDLKAQQKAKSKECEILGMIEVYPDTLRIEIN